MNVRLKGIPAETLFQVRGQVSYNSQATGIDDFLQRFDIDPEA